jgi:hypothetical protein
MTVNFGGSAMPISGQLIEPRIGLGGSASSASGYVQLLVRDRKLREADIAWARD